MRILIVAPNISARMGGEAVLPLHYFRELRKLGVDVVALTHARVREELGASPLWAPERFHFVEDTGIERGLNALGQRAPQALRDIVFNSAVGAATMVRLGAEARRLATASRFDVIHQPAPVSPQFPSSLTNMPAPVVIGPLNGAMDFPPAFAAEYSKGSEAAVKAARGLSGLANGAFPGKRQARKILVANQRTRAGLPGGIDPARVELLVENGVDLDLWTPPPTARDPVPTFVYVGRLVWWKAVELLIAAFGRVAAPARLVIVGDGPDRARLEADAAAARAEGREIAFAGFCQHAEIRDLLARSTALVLPSLREAGGAVVLEAFACRTPAIATDWGGPQDYVTPETGFLIPPSGKEQFVSGLAAAIEVLARDPQRAARMGEAARARVEKEFSWAAKARRMMDIYESVRAA